MQEGETCSRAGPTDHAAPLGPSGVPNDIDDPPRSCRGDDAARGRGARGDARVSTWSASEMAGKPWTRSTAASAPCHHLPWYVAVENSLDQDDPRRSKRHWRSPAFASSPCIGWGARSAAPEQPAPGPACGNSEWPHQLDPRGSARSWTSDAVPARSRQRSRGAIATTAKK